MARPRRFERPTPAFGGLYSIQLSYGRLSRILYTIFINKGIFFNMKKLELEKLHPLYFFLKV